MEKPHFEHASEESAAEKERSEHGKNVIIRNFWIRHAQKMSGEIVATEKTQLSASAISAKGAEQAQQRGTAIEAKAHGAKGFVSASERTGQTLENILEGYQASNPGVPVRSKRLREELSVSLPPEFLKLYDEKFGVQKQRLLAEQGLRKEQFATLSPDEQERIAEAAEEPVLREWLEDPQGELAKLYPPDQAAARFAHLFQRRHERLAGKLNDGSEVDLFHLTHKSVSEPFLVSGVLRNKTDGQPVTKLEQLGGSLETLGEWESDVTTDNDGNSTVIVRMRGEEYTLDPDVLQRLLAVEQAKKETRG